MRTLDHPTTRFDHATPIRFMLPGHAEFGKQKDHNAKEADRLALRRRDGRCIGERASGKPGSSALPAKAFVLKKQA